MRLVPVPTAMLPKVWPDLGGFIARSCGRPGCDHTEGSLLSACLAGEAQLTAVIGPDRRSMAAGVTQVREHDDGTRSCWVLALGGLKAGPWPDVIAQIEDGAQRVGCATVEFIGRRAWSRVLPGYRAEPCETGIHYRKIVR